MQIYKDYKMFNNIHNIINDYCEQNVCYLYQES